MFEKMNEKDRRALKFGVIALACLLAFAFLRNWLSDWSEVRQSLADTQRQLESLKPDTAENVRLRQHVPVFEMPGPLEKQKFFFRDKLCEQFKKTGVGQTPLEELTATRSRLVPAYKSMCFRYRGKTQFRQVMDLLADLNSNPYLFAVEQFSLKCDAKNRQQVDMELTVSTLGK